MEYEEELLENEWIKEFESIDKGYENFYTEDQRRWFSY